MHTTCTISISVVIPTFNRASQLRSTLIALLNSVAGHSSLGEVVVVDDGSTDETCSVVKQIGQGIRYLRTDRFGQAGARNQGVRVANTSHVLFLDDDITVPKDYYQCLVDTQRLVGCDWVVGRVTTAAAMPSSALICYIRHSERETKVRPKRVESVMEGTFTAQNLLVEKKQFLELGGFRTDYHRSCCEDMDLGERALMAGMRIWYAPELTVEHCDPNLLDFRRFAIRQYHGCIGHAQFFARFSAPREKSALYAKIATPTREEGIRRWLRWSLQRLMAATPICQALFWAASFGECARLPNPIKWLLFRASISSQMMAGFRYGSGSSARREGRR